MDKVAGVVDVVDDVGPEPPVPVLITKMTTENPGKVAATFPVLTVDESVEGDDTELSI